MGWTYTQRSKVTHPTIKSFFEARWNNSNVEVVDCAVVERKEAYLAIRDRQLNKVFGMVCLLDYRPNDTFNFGFKMIDEYMGPGYNRCPERILNALTPIPEHADAEYAIYWRKRCREYHKARKARNK
jgi:hypothetical protein